MSSPEEYLLQLNLIERIIAGLIVFIFGFIFSYKTQSRKDTESDFTYTLLIYTFLIIFVLVALFPAHLMEFITEYFAGLLGVYSGFSLERRNERAREKKEKETTERIYQEKLDRMSAYIYMELAENYFYFNPSAMNSDFITNYWEVFKDDLGNWQGKELVKIIRIYNLMEKVVSPSNTTHQENTDLRRLIASVLSWFQNRAESDELFKEKLLSVSEEFKEMQELFDRQIPADFSPKYFPYRRK